MDFVAASWLSEMGMDNPNFTDQFDNMDPFDEELAAVIGQDYESCSAPEKDSSTLINIASSNLITSLCNYPIGRPQHTGSEPPAKLHRHKSHFSTVQGLSNHVRASATPIILNFESAKSLENPGNGSPGGHLNTEEEATVSDILRTRGSFADPQELSMKKSTGIRRASRTYHHMVTERKRRELLTQRFVALAAVVPGLKKMHKTSILGGAVKYLRYLQEIAKTLEERAKKTVESMVLVNKSRVILEDDDKVRRSSNEHPLPEIEARACDSQILIRVHCENQRGLLANLIANVEKLNLAIVNTNVALFGLLALDITIVVEKDKKFNLTVDKVANRLRACLQAAI